MMRVPDLSVGVICGGALWCIASLSTGVALAQSRGGGGDWKTADFDAQRTSWLRSDPRLSPSSLGKDFRFLWKFQIPNDARQLNALTQPVMLDGLHSYTGMRTQLVMGSASGMAYSIDADLGRLEWKHSFGAPQPAGSLACPGGVTSAFTRLVSLPAAPAPGAGGGGGGGRAGRAGGAVGLPDQGAPNLRPGAAGGGRGGAAAASGGAGGRGGRGQVTAAPAPEDGGAPVAVGRGGGVALGRTDAFYSVSGDGMVHALNVQDGSDLVPPVKFLPAGANVSGLMLFDRTLYAATSNDCGGAANGLWAIDFASPDKAITTWKSHGGGNAGTAGPAAGTDGTLYLATADGEYSPASYSDAVVALEAKTLAMKDYFTPGKVAFGTSPVVFPNGEKDWIAAAGSDSRLYLLDSGSLGGPDHHTPAYASPKISNPPATDFVAGALATWVDSGGTRWVLMPVAGPLSPDVRFAGMNGQITNGAIVAFKVVFQNGTPALQPAWMSRDLVSPAPPIVVNGIVFALATGEFHTSDATVTAAQRAQRSTPAVLYALDAATGKEVWNSGTTMTSFVHSGGLSSGNSQVYVSTYNSVLYTFGVPMERYP
jgi:outer membrane protein assembly factor BamB